MASSAAPAPDGALTSPERADDRGSLWPFVLAWLVACAILVAMTAPRVAAFSFPDPDDTLRLQQVRDWLGGQSWFDLNQYRMNPPEGAPMHWSRLVDVPIAAVILLLTPLIGQAGAETAALVLVPLLTLGIVMALTAAIVWRLLGRDHALLASLLVPVSETATHQLRPMRIDHHGWQMALALVALLAALDPRQRRSGLIAGAAAAVWLQISLEGLPFAIALVAFFAIRWLIDPRQGERLVATTASLAGCSLLLFLLTKDGAAWAVQHCDAVSPVHLTILGLGALGCLALVRSGIASLPAKLACFAALGAAAVATMATMAPVCAAGPFARLDPLVDSFWYQRVSEGLPIWRQAPAQMMMTIAFPLIGLFGSWKAYAAAGEDRRDDWATILFLLAAALLTAMMVQRAGAVANLFAIPGGVFLFRRALLRAREVKRVPRRVVATFGAMLIVAPSHIISIATLAVIDRERIESTRAAMSCYERAEIRALNALPTGYIAAPMDIAPAIITETPHSIVASGHHRNMAAMHDLIRMFIAPPEEAERIVRRRSIDYVVVCPGLIEPRLYAAHGPDGLWDQLSKGQAPQWLVPVPVEGAKTLRIWRVAAADPR
jgi:hypothetical protein